MRHTDSILVGFDYDETNKDECVLVVGRKRVNRDSVEVINAFHGKEAKELYEKLITKEDKNNVQN
jgi:hypothetical protein